MVLAARVEIITGESRRLPRSSEDRAQVTDNKQGTIAQPLWKTKGQVEWLLGAQRLSYCMVLWGRLDQQCSQLAGNLFCLYSESLVTAWVSNRPSSSRPQCIKFHKVRTQFLLQFQAGGPPQFSQTKTLLHHVNQLQLLTQNMPSLPQGQTQAQIPCSLPSPPLSSLSWIRSCTAVIPTSQMRVQFFNPFENKCLERPLKKLLKWRMVLASVLQKPQEAIIPPIFYLPQGSQASQTPKSAAPFHEYSESQVQEKQVLTQPLAPACEVSKAVPETKSWYSDSLLKKNSITLQLKNPREALQHEPEDQLQNLVVTSQKAQDDNKYSENNFKGPKKSDSGSHFSRNLDKKHLGKCLQEHLGEKLGQLYEGLVPGYVQRSWLTPTYSLNMSSTHKQPRNLACSKNQETHMDTSQNLSFLDLKTCLLLEAHIKSPRLRLRRGRHLQAPRPVNVHIGAALDSLLPQPTFTSLVSWDSWPRFIGKVGIIPEELSQKVLEQKEITQSLYSLHSHLPALSVACKKMQRSCSETPAWQHYEPTKAPPAKQQGRHLPPPPPPPPP
ncbi:spermatogenesis-associated protein 31E1-like, partial [Fukomys damarensis]|uniref:spermatogenesis-associated protein 31E1-like n=1 Tax=Fukomys damarensis TaxID=885580 RepID=UPI00053FE830